MKSRSNVCCISAGTLGSAGGSTKLAVRQTARAGNRRFRPLHPARPYKSTIQNRFAVRTLTPPKRPGRARTDVEVEDLAKAVRIDVQEDAAAGVVRQAGLPAAKGSEVRVDLVDLE